MPKREALFITWLSDRKVSINSEGRLKADGENPKARFINARCCLWSNGRWLALWSSILPFHQHSIFARQNILWYIGREDAAGDMKSSRWESDEKFSGFTNATFNKLHYFRPFLKSLPLPCLAFHIVVLLSFLSHARMILFALANSRLPPPLASLWPCKLRLRATTP